MMSRELILNNVSIAIDEYEKYLSGNYSIVTDQYEQTRLDNAYTSLRFFTNLVLDVLESKERFLTNDEIDNLKNFVNYFDVHHDAIINVNNGTTSNPKDTLNPKQIYRRSVQIADGIDIVKPIVRVFHFQRTNSVKDNKNLDEVKALISRFKENQNSLTSALAMLDEKLETTSQIIGTATAKLKDINKHQENLEKVGGKYQSTLSILDIESESLAQKKNDLTAAHELLDNVRKTYDSNDKLLKGLGDEFSKLKSSVSTMVSKATTIENELNQKTTNIDSIITKANAALETSTTVSVGSFFKDQYDISKKGMLIWPGFALMFLCGAIWICFDTLKDMRPGTLEAGTEISYLIARFCIAPLFLLGAWFCTNQYIKQKNITEDYAYKKVLSLSLIGFKSEIEKTGEANTTGFIKSLLKEILRSPLETLDKKHYKRETKLLKLAHDEMIANMFKNVTSKNNEPDADKK